MTRKKYTLPYHCIRSIKNPHTEDLGLKIYTGYLNIKDLVKLPTNDNVRGYIVDAGKLRKRTKVHRAIEECLVETPDVFSVLNSGTTIVARSVEVNDGKKEMYLELASIINGANTQGVVRDVLEGYDDVEENWIKFELVVTDDEEIIASITISRNLQIAVQDLSIFGKKSMFKELEKVSGLKLQHSETDQDPDLVDTAKLVQVLVAMTPPALWFGGRILHAGRPMKTYAYNMKNRCLKEFAATWTSAKDPEDKDHKQQKELYDFYLQQAADAWKTFCKWKKHDGFNGLNIRKGVVRNGRKIEEVSDGFVFPILAALSLLYVKKNGKWRIYIPKEFVKDLEGDLARCAAHAYFNLAHSKHFEMGRSKIVHDHVASSVTSFKAWGDRMGSLG